MRSHQFSKILQALTRIEEKVDNMTVDFSELTAAIALEQTAITEAVALIANTVNQISAAVSSEDANTQANLNALVATLNSQTQVLVTAVTPPPVANTVPVANTPASN